MDPCIIILAAGGSARLGSPKQLLQYGDSTLLLSIIEHSKKVSGNNVVVVTGAYREEVEQSIRGAGVRVVYNKDWETGMASTIRTGVQSVGSAEVCIITVCDQPFVTENVLRNLVSEHVGTGKGICASSYSDTIGTPALFTAKYFGELLALKGDEGAKKLLILHADDLATVPFPKGVIDVDTREDYQKL